MSLFFLSRELQSCNSYKDYCDLDEVGLDQEETHLHQHRYKRGSSSDDDGNRTVHALTVSKTLDRIFHESRYDAKFRNVEMNVVFIMNLNVITSCRPDVEGDATIVDVNIYVRSMGQVDESKSLFTLDIYFRQYWTDSRLIFNDTKVEELVLNWQFLTWIWRPDTYFVNGQESYLHKVAVPNRFIRFSLNRYLKLQFQIAKRS